MNRGPWGFVVGEGKRIGFERVYGKWRFWCHVKRQYRQKG